MSTTPLQPPHGIYAFDLLDPPSATEALVPPTYSKWEGTDRARSVIERKYLAEGETDPTQMCTRVADALQAAFKRRLIHVHEEPVAEAMARRFGARMFERLVAQHVMMGGRTMCNIGTKNRLVANCVVLERIDDVETLGEAIVLQKAGCGIGYPLDTHPAFVHPTDPSLDITGPVSIMQDVFSPAFEAINQERHGANMGVMRVDHPDILAFIKCKAHEGKTCNFNISVAITTAFMNQLNTEPDSPWMCTYEGSPMPPRRICEGADGLPCIVPATITVSELFRMLCEYAARNGEPGCVFIDEANAHHPLASLGPIRACNPCGEQFITDGDTCNLGTINLGATRRYVFFRYGHVSASDRADASRTLARFPNRFGFNSDRLVEDVQLMMLAGDLVLDEVSYPPGRVAKNVLLNRRFGLGFTGFADLLVVLGIRYASQDAMDLCRLVCTILRDVTHGTSHQLALAFGVFPNYKHSTWHTEYDYPMRNLMTTTMAPTGTLSWCLGDFDINGKPRNIESSGIEPIIYLSYTKRLRDGTKFPVVNALLDETLDRLGIPCDKAYRILFTEPAPGKPAPTLMDIPGMTQADADVFVTSGDLTGMEHVSMQSQFQRYVDNAVSKTTNLPEGSTVDDVMAVYVQAWKSKCKGTTVYIAGSRELVVLEREYVYPYVQTEDADVVRFDQTPAELAELEEDVRGMLLSELTHAERSDKSLVVSDSSGNSSSSDLLEEAVTSHSASPKQTGLCPECGDRLVFRENCAQCSACLWGLCTV